MDVTKYIAFDGVTANDLKLWLAQYIKREFERYPQAWAAVMPHWEQVSTTQSAQSTWGALRVYPRT